jgi:hypothetical protein
MKGLVLLAGLPRRSSQSERRRAERRTMIEDPRTTNESSVYHFVTTWRMEGTCDEVADILGDPLRLSVWWPSVYLKVDEIEPARAENGVGRRVGLLTKGWLPYTLRWELLVVDARYPHGSTIAATGDLEGTGVWTFEQDGEFVDISYDWRIRATKPLLRNLSFLLRPLFEANHRWAMTEGEKSLRLELARQRATSDAQRRAIPPPPGPTTLAGAALVGAAAAGVIAAAYLVYRTRRRSTSG